MWYHARVAYKMFMLIMEPSHSSQTLWIFYQGTRCRIQREQSLQVRQREPQISLIYVSTEAHFIKVQWKDDSVKHNVFPSRDGIYYQISIYLSIYLSICLSTHLLLYSPLLALEDFSVSWFFTQSVRLLGQGSARRKAATCTQTSMPQVGFEPTIPVFERVNTIHALDRAATLPNISCRNHALIW
jgi:hypothetical protein